ncbi:kelch repeat-containing protein [Elusimicrobiota bacterium]
MPDGRVLILGGVNTAGTPQTTMIIHDTRNASYYSAGALPVARASHTATILPDGRILVAGGLGAGAAILNTTDIYDPQANTWDAAPPSMGAGNNRHSHTATLLPNGRVLIAGGQNVAAGVTATCLLFTPGADTFATTDPLLAGRAGHTATLANNGLVFVAGGYLYNLADMDDIYLETTELFDPDFGANGTWMPGPGLVSRRAHHTATALADGRIAIIGGYNGRDIKGSLGYLGINEIYNPVDDTIYAATEVEERRAFHTAVLKADGEVLVYGGLSNFTTHYYTGSFTFSKGSTVTLTNTIPNVITVGGITGTPGSMSFKLTMKLDIPTAGQIEDGMLMISSGRVQLDDGVLQFNEPLQVNLTGVSISTAQPGGYIDGEMVWIDNPLGQVFFTPQQLQAEDTVLTAGTVNFLPATIPGSGEGVINPAGSTLTAPITFELPISNKNSVIRIASATIVAGSITRDNNDELSIAGYSIELTSGVADIPAGTIVDSNGSLSANLVFTNLYGKVNNSSTTALPSGEDISALKLTGLSLRVEYVTSVKQMGEEIFELNVATVIVNRMVSGSVVEYNPKEDSWAWTSEKFLSTYRRGHSGLLLPNGDLVSYGGWTCNWRCFSEGTIGLAPQVILPVPSEDDLWDEIAVTPDEPRANHTQTLLPDGRVLIVGGGDGPNALRASYLYDPSDVSLTRTGDMGVPRARHTATLLTDGTVMVAGGFTTGTSTAPTASAEIYYPAVGKWIPTTSMSSSRTFHTAMLLPNGTVLVAGGDSVDNYLQSAEVYISTSRMWTTVPNMGTRRSQHTMNLLPNGHVLVVGGINAGGVVDNVESYHAGAWTARTSMNDARHSHIGMTMLGGFVLAAGGNDGFKETDRAELYDPSSDSWAQLGKMHVGKTDVAASLSPNGNVLLAGGYSAEGLDGLQTLSDVQAFDVMVGTFIGYGSLGKSRSEAVATQLLTGDVFVSGGWGLEEKYKIYRLDSEAHHFSAGDPDGSVVVPYTGSPRQAFIVRTDTHSFDRGGNFTAMGERFKDQTEASGGGSASQDTHHAQPIVRLMRLDSGGTGSQSAPSFFVDLTTRVFNLTTNPDWEKVESSISVVLPSTEAGLPYGWYQLRVGANAVYSDGYVVQAAPPKPTGKASIPIGAEMGVSSISWTWDSSGVSNNADGFNVYSATNNVWLATVPYTGGNVTWYQTGLGPDTSSLIKVVPYTLAGDGEITVSTVPRYTRSSHISWSTGTALSTGSILFQWTPNSNASEYHVFSATWVVEGSTIANITAPTAEFTWIDLDTNTAYGITIRAKTTDEERAGELTPAVTVYTHAAPPAAVALPFEHISSVSWSAHWGPNTNPPVTTYRLRYKSQFSTQTYDVEYSSITDIWWGVNSLEANTRYDVEVTADNGDGKTTEPWTVLGSTVTNCRLPLNPNVTAADSANIWLEWESNGNSTVTLYQVVLSTNDWQTIYSTPIAYTDNYTSTSAVLTTLLTGNTYYIRIWARDQYKQETTFAFTDTFTDNGGADPGKLALTLAHDQFGMLDGNLNGESFRKVSLRFYPYTFEQDVRIFVSTQGVMNCGGTDGVDTYGISLQVIPDVQPVHPFELGIFYDTLTNKGNLNTLGIVRYDPASKTCTHLRSQTDQAPNVKMVRAMSNHMSDFYIQQISPEGSLNHGFVFPNPLYTKTQSYFTFDRWPQNTRFRVYTLHGELLADGESDQRGMFIWDAKNKAGRYVASGLYLAVIEKEGERKIMKIAVVR